MNKFNLTFKGEILVGKDPAQAKLRFGKLFGIDDPKRLERFFSGQTIILRRNLERKAAAQYYRDLHELGIVVALVKVTQSDAADAPATPPSPKTNLRKAPEKSGAEYADPASQIKARKEQSLRLAAEEASREKAALAERQHRAAVNAEREQAKADENRRRVAEEAARRTEELAEKRRLEEEEARQEALKAEARRKAAEEVARQEAKHKAEAEAARQEALKAEARRQAAEEAARREAELAELTRRNAEEAARKKAAKAEARRKAAEETARRKAQKAQEKAERARQKAAESARHKAELEAIKRRKAEEAARRQAELDEIQRLEAEEAARLQAELDAIKLREAEEAARLHAEFEAQARQAAAEAARIKAEALREQEEAQRKSAERRHAAAAAVAARQALRKNEKHRAVSDQAEQQVQLDRQSAEQAARHKEERHRREAQALQEQAVSGEALREKVEQRAALALAQQAPFKTARARVKTSLEVPLRNDAQRSKPDAPSTRKRQPGEPNLYALRPFRNTEAVRGRAKEARRRMRQSYTLAAIALVVLLVVGGGFLRQAGALGITGAHAIAIEPQGGPLLLAGNSLLFHDRAGVGTKEIPLSALGLSTLEAPLAFDSTGALFGLGRLDTDGADASRDDAPQLLRCDLEQSMCRHFSPDLKSDHINAFVIHPLDDIVLLADTVGGQLLKANRDGVIEARANVILPEHPVLRLHSGLLLMNSAEGPAIGVFRYEKSAFGQQLDEILLLPPGAVQEDQSQVGDFLFSGGAWWASLHNPASGDLGLYRFDGEWNYLDQVALPLASDALQLSSWGEKTLVNNPRSAEIQRFNAAGTVEAPLVSMLLQDLIAGRQRNIDLTRLAWRGGLLLCLLVAALSLGYGYLQGLRSLVYKPHREHGAQPIDNYADALQWLDRIQDRPARLRRIAISYGLLVLALLLMAVGQIVTAWQLAALLTALSGPAIALLLLSRQSVGHIGILQDKLLLVDHSGMYHLGSGSSVLYRGPFLLIDDVVVFIGNHFLPTFSSTQLQQLVSPLAKSGVKVDRNTLLVKLLQSHHPLTQGAFSIMAAGTAAAVMLSLHGLF